MSRFVHFWENLDFNPPPPTLGPRPWDPHPTPDPPPYPDPGARPLHWLSVLVRWFAKISNKILRFFRHKMQSITTIQILQSHLERQDNQKFPKRKNGSSSETSRIFHEFFTSQIEQTFCSGKCFNCAWGWGKKMKICSGFHLIQKKSYFTFGVCSAEILLELGNGEKIAMNFQAKLLVRTSTFHGVVIVFRRFKISLDCQKRKTH